MSGWLMPPKMPSKTAEYGRSLSKTWRCTKTLSTFSETTPIPPPTVREIRPTFADHAATPPYHPGGGTDIDHGHSGAPSTGQHGRRGGSGVTDASTGHAAVAAQVSAAAAINCVTSAGWETMATWLEGTSMVVAPIGRASW